MKKKNKIYALYYGDKFLALGTKKEIAEEINVKIETIYFYGTPSYKNRKSRTPERYILIAVEED